MINYLITFREELYDITLMPIPMLFSLILSLVLNIYFSFKTVSLLDDVSDLTEERNSFFTTNLWLYALVQIVTVAPATTFEVVFYFTQINIHGYGKIINILVGFIGLGNVAAYFVKKTVDAKRERRFSKAMIERATGYGSKDISLDTRTQYDL